MTDKKISELNELLAALDVDLLAIVDTAAGETKRIKKENLLAGLVPYLGAVDDLDLGEFDIISEGWGILSLVEAGIFGAGRSYARLNSPVDDQAGFFSYDEYEAVVSLCDSDTNINSNLYFNATWVTFLAGSRSWNLGGLFARGDPPSWVEFCNAENAVEVKSGVVQFGGAVFKIKRISDDSEPDIALGEMVIWHRPTDHEVYLKYNDPDEGNATIKLK